MFNAGNYCMKCKKLKPSLNWHPKYMHICNSCKSDIDREERKKREEALKRNRAR